MPANLPSFTNILTALLIFGASYYAGVWLSRLLNRVLQRSNAEPGVSHLLSQILKWTIISLGFTTALQRFFNVTAFLTGLGIIGFTIGFALQNIMQNFMSGVILLIQQPFKVGDDVTLSGHEGTVLKIGLRTTELRLRNGLLAFLPNADVLAQPIINYSRTNGFRVELPVSIPYKADTEKVRAAILREIKSIDGYMESPAPRVLFHTFGQSSVDLTVQFWINYAATDHHIAKDMALVKIKRAFEKLGMDMPYLMQVMKNPVKRKTK
ncbi:MAG: mechanosensitive ion channel family protein [Anaerolineales bacterium]|uniref:mechanosensitive ion channel family protein n=1 Tax=Candidatus Villigracilis vicinus TaxID=3140679 RepID=UPI0031369BCE|nr:mechanosensitive ion channel family protein [Anaerolineales bacterium]